MNVPATLAEWLRSPELIEEAQNASAADWGDLAIASAVSSPLALRSDAASEATRQAEFFGVAVAVETLELPGRKVALVGTSQRIEADTEGYVGAPVVFVIAAQEREGGTTLLTVLRRMGGS